MLKILIVDDNADKLKNIKDAILEFPDIKADDITTASDCVNARRELSNYQYDLLILDMLLPERFGDDVVKTAGVDLLSECKNATYLNKPFHIIGVTQYDDLKAEFNDTFDEELWALVKYDPGSIVWKNQINNKIKYLVQSKHEISSSTQRDYVYDIAIITALHEPELISVLDLDANFKKYTYTDDPTPYYQGCFIGNNKKLKVVAASSSQMGMTASSTLSTKIINRFRPKYLIMVGISAGLKGYSNIGDVLVCEMSWDYGSGKIKCNKDGETIFNPDSKYITIDPFIKEHFLAAKMERKFLDEIRNSWRGSKPTKPLEVIIGPLASGAAVVQNKSLIDEIKSHQRKLIGIEMEGYGVFYAANNSIAPRPIPMIIKSVCDFADQYKNDKFQSYAAYTSAQYAYKFSLEYL